MRTGYTPLDEVKIYVWKGITMYLCTVGYKEFLAELAKHVEVEKFYFTDSYWCTAFSLLI